MNLGLVLSGGMAKGAYQIGALQAINEYIPKEQFRCISCASVGTLNGYAYAADRLPQAKQMWTDICESGTRKVITQILRSSLLQQNISSIYSPDSPLSSSFYTTLLDLNNRNVIYKDLSSVSEESLPLYLKASVAMPVYNHSVHLDGTSYYDGAMIDNIPVFPLIKHPLDYIICIYFDDICYQFENSGFDDKIIKITFPSASIVRQSLVFKKNTIEDMIQEGYTRCFNILRGILAKGFEDTEYIYAMIEQQNQQAAQHHLRITGDVMVTNLNKITQKLTKRKII